MSRIYIVFLCILLMSVSTISVYGSSPSSIEDVYTVITNDDFTILDFDVNQTYYREYIVYDDSNQSDTIDIWSYGKSKNFVFHDYMDVAALYIYPMSGSNETSYLLPITNFDEQMYYDVNLQFDVSEYIDIIASNLRLYISYYGDNGLINQDSILYTVDQNGVAVSEERQLVCPAGTTSMRLHFRLYFDGDAVSGTYLNSDFTLNKFQLKFNEQKKGVSMTVTNIITAIVEGATGILSGIGAGAVDFFESIFLTTDGALSSLGTYLLVFVGIGMAIGVMRWIRSKVG